MDKEIKTDLQRLNLYIKKCNNVNLVNSNSPPQLNMIYKLYPEGKLTEEFGGWVYGNRPVNTLFENFDKVIDGLVFPSQGYAMLNRKDALFIRGWIDRLSDPKKFKQFKNM